MINEKKETSSNSNMQNLGQKLHSKPSSFSCNSSQKYSPHSSDSQKIDIENVDLIKLVRHRPEGEGDNEKSS